MDGWPNFFACIEEEVGNFREFIDELRRGSL